ncbi:STAS domain-containing protein [Pleomorphovibrio marinus]|uniref:STAS domain-containing protein n=1 Tax=Pleomorphovibrio marinus TaxID=2164132 RepID=UPI000E0A9E28|nr:STAS domain-containing protein [Pleomorphovibrio marinus]
MLEITQTKDEACTIITLKGEVDASNSVELDAAIQEAVKSGSKNILVEGNALEYISSAGLGVFMSYLEDFQESNISFIIFGLSEKVGNVFHILGLDQLITLVGNKEEALARIYEA